ncbi:hypothetical protein GRJ2_001284500 [Grus japonensis]|uniref:Uncharacterized protein n=1 Tax=Grus japonensis TaxID=30415 RepID=A0ABC9WSW0_GRUJA
MYESAEPVGAESTSERRDSCYTRYNHSSEERTSPRSQSSRPTQIWAPNRDQEPKRVKSMVQLTLKWSCIRDVVGHHPPLQLVFTKQAS